MNFFQALPDADKDWQGECFVFDNRVAVDTHLQETDTTSDDVYNPDIPDERWRLERAHRLSAFTPKVHREPAHAKAGDAKQAASGKDEAAT